MDAEHAVQLTLLDSIDRAVQESRSDAELNSLLDQFIEYTFVHFVSEQVLMQRSGYPGLEMHRQQHDQLLQELRAVQTQTRSGEAHVNSDLATDLRGWLIIHIEGMDRAFADYLESTGQTA
jgi:hemerythrin